MTKAPPRPLTVRPDKKVQANDHIARGMSYQLKRTMLPRSLDVFFSLRYRR